jgi:hypothetical protein
MLAVHRFTIIILLFIAPVDASLARTSPPVGGYKIIHVYPHDPSALRKDWFMWMGTKHGVEWALVDPNG